MLRTSVRVSKGEITDPVIHEQIDKAVRYANSLGLKVALDLDVRLARRAFQERHSDELQEELIAKFSTVNCQLFRCDPICHPDLLHAADAVFRVQHVFTTPIADLLELWKDTAHRLNTQRRAKE